MLLDIPTLMVAIAAVCVVKALIMWVLARTLDDTPELCWWLAGAATMAASFALTIGRGTLPVPFTHVLADTGIVMSVAVIREGVRRYGGGASQIQVLWAIAAASIFSFSVFTYAVDHAPLRFLVMGLIGAGLCASTAWHLIQADRRKRVVKSRRYRTSVDALAAAPFVIHATVTLVASIATIGPAGQVIYDLAGGIVLQLLLLEAFIFILAITGTLPFLVLVRLKEARDETIWATNAGTWEWHVIAGRGRVNERWATMIGYRPDELTIKTPAIVEELMHPDDIAPARAMMERVLSGLEERYRATIRMRHKDGNWVYMQSRGRVVERTEQGQLIRMVGTNQDVTEMVMRDQQIRDREELLRNLARQVPGMIYQYLLRPDGTACFPYASDGIRQVYGVAPEDVRESGDAISRIIHPEDVDQLACSVLRSAQSLLPWRAEFRVVLPGAEPSWREGMSAPQRLPDGSTLWHGFISNIDARVAEREALQAYASDLEYAKEKLEEQAEDLVELAEKEAALNNQLRREAQIKDRFFSIIAHDLRGPFTPILGMTEMMAMMADRLPPEKVKEYADDIHTAAVNLHDLVEQLLDWSRVQMGSYTAAMENFGLADAADRAIDQVRAMATAKGVDLSHEIRAGLSVHADPNIVVTVLRNLITNSIKFTDKGGRIWIAARSVGTRVQCAVHDTGVGIDPKVADHLFDVAVKTTTSGTAGEAGTGLGLPLSSELIRMNGGSITAARHEDGSGSVFTVTLPLYTGG